MEKQTPTPPDQRDLINGSATIGAMLLVCGSAKLGYGVWALGLAALTCLLYRVGKYLVILIGRFVRSASAEPLWRLRRVKGRDNSAAAPVTS